MFGFVLDVWKLLNDQKIFSKTEEIKQVLSVALHESCQEHTKMIGSQTKT